MKIGFLIERKIYYKYFGSLIEEASLKGHEVFCFHDYAQPKDGRKGYQFPDIESVPLRLKDKIKAIPFHSEKELIDSIKVDVIVSLHFLEKYLSILNQLKGIKWVSLQNGADTLVSKEYLHHPDLVLFYSQKWIDYCDKEMKAKPVGFLEIDQKNIIDRESVKEEWGIPKDKKVLLYFPFPFSGGHDRFWEPIVYGMNNKWIQLPLSLFSFKKRYIHQVLRGYNDERLVKVIREFCDRNNLYFLVKLRKKNPLKDYLKEAADKVLYDEEFYPSTVMKSIMISDLCLSFLSTAVLESVALNVPHVCITPSQKDWKNLQHVFWKKMFDKMKPIFDFKTATRMISIKQAFELFSSKDLSYFSSRIEDQREYINMFVGENDTNYSKKALNQIESL